MFSFENIYRAYRECRKNKRNTHNALIYEINLLENLWSLQKELESRSYRIGRSICFLTNSPKLREVFAADFRDRVVHHILVRELEKIYEHRFIHDVYNNRKNRGIHQAAKRAQRFMHASQGGWYLQLDIKGFFYSLDKNILFKQIFSDLQRYLRSPKKEQILYLANKIIYHDPTKNYIFKGDATKLALLPPHKTLFKIPKQKGLPIGNLTSQFFANIYMNRFDHYVKRVLKVKHYIRYVDDFVLFDSSKERLRKAYSEIKNYLLRYLGLELRGDTKLKKHTEGLDFLGYIIRPTHLLVRKRVVNNYKCKKAQYLESYEAQRGKMSLEEIKRFLSVQASFASHTKHANSYNLMHKTGAINETDPFDFDRT